MTLHQNWPNPAHGTTTISFSLDESAYVSLDVFDPLGRKVSSLVGQDMAPGDHHVTASLGGLPAGTYVYRLRAGAYETARVLTLLH